MKAKAVSQANVKPGLNLFSLGLSLLVVGLISLALAGNAIAAPVVGKDGQVRACYVVKGKAKGAMRVVPANKKCRRGERKLAWSIAGPAGPRGDSGSSGEPASGAGAPGSNGTPGLATLETKIASLTLKVGLLENLLQGVGNGDLSGLLGTLNGITNQDLTGALAKLSGVSGTQLNEVVGSLPAIDSLCTQASGLTTQVNSLGTALGGLSLNGVLTVLGGLLNIPALPASLPAFTCPS